MANQGTNGIRLTWGGSIEAQRQADSAYGRLRKRRLKQKQHKKMTRSQRKRWNRRRRAKDGRGGWRLTFGQYTSRPIASIPHTYLRWLVTPCQQVPEEDRIAVTAYLVRLEQTMTARSREYRRYLETDHWKQRRAKAIALADGKCQRCDSEEYLQVHHVNYKRLYAEKDADLLVLCRWCHRSEHPHSRRNQPPKNEVTAPAQPGPC